MSINNVARALQLIQNTVKTTEITTPISKNKYVISSLKGKDEHELKQKLTQNQNSARIAETLYSIMYNTITNNKNVNDENILSFEDFLKNNSTYDAISLFHALNITTFEYIKDFEFICEHCGVKNKLDKLEYKQYKNRSKVWDKDQPFDSYTIKYTYNTNDLTIDFSLGIPTLYDEVMITKKVIEERPATDMFVTTSSNLDKALYITKQLTIKSGDEEITLTNIFDIKVILESLPENIILSFLDTYEDNIKDYIPDYTVKIKCKDCEKENELTYHPILEFIMRMVM